MKTQDIVLYSLFGVLAAVLLVVVGTMVWPREAEVPSQQAISLNQNIGQSGEPSVTVGTTDQGDVEISLTPKGVQNGKFVVGIAANTHSVDLAPFDLTKLATLTLKGKQYTPLSASSLSGHHAQGTLEFDLGEDPEAFTITIRGIPLEEERVFRWE